MMPRLSSERGILGSKLIIGLIFLAVLVVAAVDGGAIFVTRLGVSDAAQQASFDAAERYNATGDVREAEKAAQTTAENKGAKLAHLVVNKETGAVTVTITKEAPTVFIQHLSFLPDWGRVKEIDTSVAPPP